MSPSTVNPSETITELTASPRRKSSARKLLHAAALAAVLVPLGSVAANAATISFSGNSGGSEGGGVIFHQNTTDAYSFDLTFDHTYGAFDVTVNVTEYLLGQFPSSKLVSFPGYTCVPIMGGTTCVEFEVLAPLPSTNTWLGDFHIFITWAADTNGAYPNDPGNRIRILHARGDDCPEGNTAGCAPNGLPNYDTDITDEGSYCPLCTPPVIPNDAGIGGTDNNFQNFTVVQAPEVPEPTTLLLLGSGVSALLYRRRRQRQDRDTCA
jgi:hypothetical protein